MTYPSHGSRHKTCSTKRERVQHEPILQHRKVENIPAFGKRCHLRMADAHHLSAQGFDDILDQSCKKLRVKIPVLPGRAMEIASFTIVQDTKPTIRVKAALKQFCLECFYLGIQNSKKHQAFKTGKHIWSHVIR